MAGNLLALLGGFWLFKRRKRDYEPVTPHVEELPPPLDSTLVIYYSIDDYDDVVWQYGFSRGSGANMHLDYTYVIGNKEGTAFVTTTGENKRKVILADDTVIDNVQFWDADIAVERLDASYAATQGAGDTIPPVAPPISPQTPQGPQGGSMGATRLETNPAWIGGGWA